MTTTELDKTCRLGATSCGNVYVKITYKQGNLSITGVEGPLKNGNARGSCGQIVMSMTANDFKDFAPGWSAEKVTEFFEVWDRWHLNDMRAGCEHQRSIDITEKIEVVTYKLTCEALDLRKKAQEKAAQAAVDGLVADLSATEKELLTCQWFKDIHSPPDSDSPLSGCYEVSKREQKAIVWVSPSEHPRGMLGKPCDVCGYKYGTKWLREEVPAEVLDWLADLPETDITPAWV